MANFLPWMGIGMTVGNFISLGVLVISNRDAGLHYQPVIDFHDPHLCQFFILLAPMVLSSLVGEINAIVDKRMDSSLDEGTVSVLNYASKVNGVFSAIIRMSVGTAFYPRMSEYAVAGDISGMKDQAAIGIKLMLPILLPLTLGIILLAQPVIRILLERGEFSREATIRTAQCLQMFAIGLFAVNINQIITRAFYARKKTRLPAILSAASVVLNIICILVLISPLGARGPALATSILGTALFIGLYIFLRKDIGALHIYNRREWVKLILATGVMSLFVFILAKALPLMSASYIMRAVMLAGTVAGAVGVYAGVLIVMKSEVAVLVIGMAKSLISKHRKGIEP
jgi:putative peptidoglycan lipid II flippase